MGAHIGFSDGSCDYGCLVVWGEGLSTARTSSFIRLSILVWEVRIFRRAKHVLLVCCGQHSELPIAVAVVLLGYVLCAFILRQAYLRVEFEDQRQMFRTFPSSLISLLEVTAGDALRPLMYQGDLEIGPHAVILVIMLCFVVKHVINKILTAVVLHNLATPDPDKICYQLQFERMAWMHGWDDAEKAWHWLNSRDHSELLEHGEKQILIPDIAGSFERVNAASAGVLTGDAELGEGGRTRNPGISTSDLIDDGLALVHKIHTQAHRSLHLDAKYRLRARIVKCSDFKVEGRFADGSSCKVQVELHDFDGQVCAVIEWNFGCVYIQYMCRYTRMYFELLGGYD